MSQYLVTIKLPKNTKHDPHNKVTDICPVDNNKLCTDSTGEHHTVLFETDDRGILSTREYWKEKGFHVTRVEEV